MKLVNEHIDQINDLCNRNGVEKLYVFGSILTDQFGPESDLDFIVVFKSMPVLQNADCYFGLCEGLEDTFNRKVDLISYKSIRNPNFCKVVDRNKQLIYG